MESTGWPLEYPRQAPADRDLVACKSASILHSLHSRLLPQYTIIHNPSQRLVGMASEAEAACNFVKGLAQSRWMMLVACFFVMSSAGGLYTFGLYSQQIKIALGYDQQTINNIAFFKDVGANVGIVAGLVYDFSGAWLVLLLASIVNVFGYTMIWLAVTARIARPPVWQLCVYIAIGANSGAFATTAVIVSGVKAFPQNRGMVIGLLKGFVGLSGAMMTQLFRAIYGGNSSASSFILLIGWFPSLVYLLLMFWIRLVKPVHGKNDQRKFYVFLLMAVSLAAYLMIVIVVHSFVKVSKSVEQALAVVMLLIMLVPLGVVVQTELSKTEHELHGEYGDVFDTSSSKAKEIEPGQQQAILPSSSEGVVVVTDNCINIAALSKAAADYTSDAQSAAEPSTASKQAFHSFPLRLWRTFASEIRSRPRRGENFSVVQALSSIDFWLLFVVATCGLGTGLTVIDNLGQLGASLGYSPMKVSTFVSLLSIWNFVGRVGVGFLSEILLQKHGIPRPLFYAIISAMSMMVSVAMALNVRGSVYIGSIFVGITFGAQMPVLYAIVSELFGLRFFGTLYNVATLANPLGTYLLSVRTAGHLYDRESLIERRHQITTPAPAPATSALLCHGAHCYRLTFFIMVAFSAIGCLLSLSLSFRTRHFYKSVSKCRKGAGGSSSSSSSS